MKKNIYHAVLIGIFLLLVININDINYALGLFHSPNDQTTKFNELEEKSKHFIESVVEQVNEVSNQFNLLVMSQEGNLENKTIILETNKYIANLTDIVDRVENFSPSKEYKPLFQAYTDSLKNEVKSYTHYNKYLETSNSTENDISIDLLSKAYEYERQADLEFRKLNVQ